MVANIFLRNPQPSELNASTCFQGGEGFEEHKGRRAWSVKSSRSTNTTYRLLVLLKGRIWTVDKHGGRRL